MKSMFMPLALGLVLLGCSASDKKPVPGSESASAEVAPSSGELNRPDANNPENDNLEFPLGWKWRLDNPDPSIIVGNDTSQADIWFVTMKPGWHVTVKRPRTILYHPASTADGSYTASSKIHLFNPGRRNEAYGIFFGGKNLDKDDISYTYFLIHRSGEYIVKTRHGEETDTVTGWTANNAIVPYSEDTKGTAANTLSVHVSEAEVEFLVNDVSVFTAPASQLETDGIVGLRFNHGINAHIESLDVIADPQ